MKNKGVTSRSPATPPKKHGLVLLGMHRSGTSAITRVLNILGCALPADLIGPGDGNALGHWESQAVVDLNNAILASAGLTWNDWGPINNDWHASDLKVEMLGRITSLLTEHSALGPLFILKDPRLCRLADLWLEGMEDVGVEPLLILMLRNPVEVIQSLESRDLMTPDYSQLLWLRHVLDAEYFSRGRRRVICRYDQLMRNWKGVIDSIKSGLGVAFPRNAPSAHVKIEQFLSTNQRHHDLDIDLVFDHPGLTKWLSKTFGILLDWSEQGEDPANYQDLDKIREEFDNAYSNFGGLLARAGIDGDVGSGSRLKRELSEQLAAAAKAAEAAQNSLREAGIRQDATAALELKLAMQEEELRSRELELVKKIDDLTSGLQFAQAEQMKALEHSRQVELQFADAIGKLQDHGLRNSELSVRVGAAESALAQRQEELIQLTRLLHDKELEAQTSSITRDEAETALAERNEECGILLNRLQQLEPEYQSIQIAHTEAQKALAERNEECGILLNRLQQLEPEYQSIQIAHTEAQKALAERNEECAQLTSSLAQAMLKIDIAHETTRWSKNIIELFARFPNYWKFLPRRIRIKLQYARYKQAGLFDAALYQKNYPDVGNAGIDPLHHYLMHGWYEGRRRL